MMPLLQSFAVAARNIFKEIAPGYGRQQDTETRYLLGNPDYIEQTKGTGRWFDLSLTPYIYAGLRYRDISRLWVSAHGLDADNDGAYAPAQILFPPYAENADAEMLRFVQWQFDERLARGMKSIIQAMQFSALTYGRSIQEIDWQVQADGEYKGRVVINDVWDRDPDRFVINPKGYKPGLYLKKSVFSNTVDASDILPARKFVVLTNRKYFENQYGVSELRPLDSVSAILSQVWGFWARGLEKAGKGSIIGKYSNKLLGKGNEQARADFLAEIQKIANETVTITHIENAIETLKPEFEAAAFSEFVNVAVQQISLVLTGSSTALIEGKFGSYSKEESTTVRQKSDLEQLDASWIAEAFNFQLVPWLIDFNLPDIQAYPTLYLIQPERITPTTPKNQDQAPVDVTPNEDDENQFPGKPEQKALTGDTQEKPVEKMALLSMEDGAAVAPSTSEGESNNAAGDTTDKAQPAAQPVTRFFPSPDIYSDATVKDGARSFVKNMSAVVDREFDKLTDAEKKTAFTIAKVGDRAGLEKVIARLKDEIEVSLDEPDEEKAFARYYPKARSILRGSGATLLSPSELLISFRVTRQKAYNAGVMAYAEANKDTLHGLRWKTQEDTQVRKVHRLWNNITRPINDRVWQEMTPPIDFNCRCYLLPITKAQAAKDPSKYAYTKDVPQNRDTF